MGYYILIKVGLLKYTCNSVHGGKAWEFVMVLHRFFSSLLLNLLNKRFITFPQLA